MNAVGNQSTVILTLLLIVAFNHQHTAWANPEFDRLLERRHGVKLHSSYPWKTNIITTYFWIGDNKTKYSPSGNFKSAWDTRWQKNFGGDDCPENRVGYRPAKFFPGLNPFYVALPYNDVAHPEKRHLIPWFDPTNPPKSKWASVLRGRWVAVLYRGRFAFGTWEDVGPFRTDHAEYVFGNERPKTPTGAGLDVSPAIRDYLGLSGRNITHWRFVDDDEVPPGPWIDYGEIALVARIIRENKRRGQQLPAAAKNFNPEKISPSKD